MAEIIPTIALLSTGDELTNGNVLNTNSFYFAEQLNANYIRPGMHLTVNDDQTAIEQGMRFLLASHSALIISGGLGPTSDDRTRFALSTVINREHIFDEASWQRLVARLNRLSLAIPDCNRQQCLFPSGAEIYANDNGTAPGCRVAFGEQQIFMLPGPPFECMPMFTEKVLPFLISHHYARPLFRYEWLLLGVSEGSIAALLDPLLANSECQVGYRVNQPYLQVKLQSSTMENLTILQEKFSRIIEEQSISHCQEKASAQLLQYILKNKMQIRILDQVTGGLLSATLLTPDTFPYLHFSEDENPQATDILIILTGLNDYWHNRQQSGKMTITYQKNQPALVVNLDIPFRKERTPLYAMEIACWQILNFLKSF